MMKKFFEAFVTVAIWIGMQTGCFFVGMFTSVFLYEALPDWYDEAVWLGVAFVILNCTVSLWKLFKKRTNK